MGGGKNYIGPKFHSVSVQNPHGFPYQTAATLMFIWK